MVHISVAQFEVEYRTECIPPVGRERTAVKLHLAYQVSIDDAHGTTRSPLGTEVVDVGNFHTVQIKPVFRWRTASYYQVIAVSAGRKSHTRIRLYDSGDVTVGTRTFFYLLQTDDAQSHRTGDVTSEGRTRHRHFL